ncbi:MAG: ATP-binding protein [Nanoarchaeota archaeon]|nr:ATP-binding protein [Nanoarchaeota archaeon]
MITKDLLRQVVFNQKKDLEVKKEMIRRDLLGKILPWMKDERVLILTGVRRCGKSTLLRQMMQEVTGWCYASFEDERLLDFRAQDFELLNEALIEAYGPTNIYFFDEVQNIDKFETFVRRLQEAGKKVVLTGSNAALLSKEMGTRLTGRYKAFEVYPFSFSEFLRYKSVLLAKADWHIPEKKVALLRLFEEYLSTGGLPEYLKNKDVDYVRTLFENILYKDIIARYDVRREKIMKELVNLLATLVASPFTYNALKNALGLSNAITVKEYLSYLGNSYLFFELLKFSYSVKKQLGSPRKIYLIDSAFHRVCGATFTPDKGKNLENVVFLELKRRGKEPYYHAEKHECDFVVKTGTTITEAIQVCYSMDKANQERELSGLLEAMVTFKLKKGLLLTLEQSGELTREGKRITLMPVLAWLTQTND